MKHYTYLRTFAVSSLMIVGNAHAASTVLNLLNRFNLMTGDYVAGNETEGSTFVAGTYLPQNSSSRFGSNAGAVANDTTNVLWLNNGIGNTTGTATLLSGSLVTRVPVNRSQFILNGNGAGTPTFNEGSVAWSNALTTVGLNNAAELASTLLSASNQWANLTTNSTGSIPGNGSFTFNGTPTNIDGHQIAVFNVSAGTLFATGGFDRLEATFGGAETLLINISGTGTINANKNFSTGLQNNERMVLFNFYEATALTISTNFRGAVFAPNATVTQTANIDGSVVAGSFTQNSEVHDLHFTSYLPFTVVPEPSTVFLTATGLLVTFRRRR